MWKYFISVRSSVTIGLLLKIKLLENFIINIINANTDNNFQELCRIKQRGNTHKEVTPRKLTEVARQ